MQRIYKVPCNVFTTHNEKYARNRKFIHLAMSPLKKGDPLIENLDNSYERVSE